MHAGTHFFCNGLNTSSMPLPTSPDRSLKRTICSRIGNVEKPIDSLHPRIVPTLTAISLILTIRTMHDAIAHVRLAHATLFATVNFALSARHTRGLVRLVSAVRMPIASPVRRNATLHIA